MMPNSEFSVSLLNSKLASSREAGIPILLARSDVKKALNAFLAGEITKEEIADWAEFYDANDYVEFETNELIPDVIFEISSPEINGWLDEDRAKGWLSLLTNPNSQDI